MSKMIRSYIEARKGQVIDITTMLDEISIDKHFKRNSLKHAFFRLYDNGNGDITRLERGKYIYTGDISSSDQHRKIVKEIVTMSHQSGITKFIMKDLCQVMRWNQRETILAIMKSGIEFNLSDGMLTIKKWWN